MMRRQNRKSFNAITLNIAFMLFEVFLCTSCTIESSNDTVKMLVVHSLGAEFVSYPDMNHMIVEKLTKAGIKPDIQIFYLNCETLDESEELATLHQYVDTMKMKPEIILTTDDQATYSLLACRHPFLKKVPIVFTGVNFPNWELLKEYPNATGVWDKLNYIGNVEMIEKLLGYKRIRFYYDRSYIGRKILGELAEQIGNRDEELYDMIQHFLQNSDTARIARTEYNLGFLKKEELATELKATTFYFLNLREVMGNSLLWCLNGTFENSVSLLTRYDYTMARVGRMATIPTFSVVNKGVGYGQGILGGYFMTIDDQVDEACEYITQILKGRPVVTLPIKEGKKSYILDWNEMERWNMEKSAVEKDMQIINMPFYVEYKLEFIVFGTLFGVLIVAVICYLLFLLIREAKRKKLAQQNLREEKEYLSLVLEGGNIFAWSYEYVTEQFVFDKEFALNVGMKSERMTLEQMIQVTHPDDVGGAVNRLINVVNRKEVKVTVCVRMNFNEKDYIWYEFRMLGIPERANNKVIVVGAILSIQDFKEHEEELIAARDLAAKTELKQSFLANMSHEIRTPLNAIVGFSNILVMDEDIDEEEKREFITTININCELLLKLVNDILEISRIESGNISFVLESSSVNKIVKDVYHMNYLAVPPSVAFMEETLSEDIMLTTDSGRLKQILVNFVNNAFKFTSSGYIKVGVECLKDKGEICFYVEDTGLGIPVEEQKMIFERFYKRDEFAQGTGLGLSICMLVAEKLGGRVTLASKENEGSRFGVVIPYGAKMTEGNTIGVENMVEEDSSLEDDCPVILIAEDSVSSYMVLGRILKSKFKILWALNGRDALDIIEKKTVDLVLMDIKMQEMDGLTALKKIRKTHKNLPVIIQTAYAYDENRDFAKKAGCTDFIEKPIQAELLMRTIERCLSK